MTISNRVTLEQALNMPVRELQELPTDMIALLLEDIATLKDRVKTGDALLLAVLTAKFGDIAANERKEKNKENGAVTFSQGGFKITADLPKNVKWDQPNLRNAVRVIAEEWKENPRDYVAIEIKVSEAKWSAWPPAVRKLFQDARTESTGKQTFKIEAIAAEAA